MNIDSTETDPFCQSNTAKDRNDAQNEILTTTQTDGQTSSPD